MNAPLPSDIAFYAVACCLVFGPMALALGWHHHLPALWLRTRWRLHLLVHRSPFPSHEDAASPGAGELAGVMRAYRAQAGPDARGAEETARWHAGRALRERGDA
jgi:hypothetical protein